MTSSNTSAFTLDRRPDGVGVLVIDVPGEKQNTLKPQFAADFDAIWKEIDASDLAAIVITSGKENSFIAGADIEMIRGLTTAEDAERRSREGQTAFNRLEQARVPVVAAIHGPCLGGGLELAMACRARIVSDDASTKLGLPEVQLGLLPGAGGTQRLPELIGVEKALDMLLTGKQIDGRRAKKYGLASEVVPRAILLDVAANLALELAQTSRALTTGNDRNKSTFAGITAKLEEFALSGNPAGRKIVFDQAHKTVQKKAGDHYPAPYRILEAVRIGLEKGREAGLEAEARRFGELVVTDVSRRLVEIFFATTALKKDDGTRKDGVEALDVHKVGVLGSGIMGHGIALVTAQKAGLPVRMRDLDQRAIGRGLAAVRKVFDARVQRKRMRPGERDRLMQMITGTTDFSGFKRCEIVIEAVFEDIEVKRKVLAAVEEICGPETIFASNTSSIPITRIAESAQRPQRVVGMHYFSPVHKMPLLEVIRTEHTDDDVIATVVDLGRKQGKTVIVVNDGVGFYTTRILGPYANEAAWMLSEGIPIETIDSAAKLFGFPVGPITLLDEVGIDTAEKIARITHAEFGDRLAPPPGLEKLAAEGRTGRKGGSGFYTYGDKKKTVDKTVYAALGVTPDDKRRYPLDELGERLALAMVCESIRCLSDGILRSPRDGDIGAVFGLGFPPFRGGPFRYADSVGAADLLKRVRTLADRFGDRFAPPEMLTDRARSGNRFYER